MHLRVGAARCVSEGCVLGWRLLWQQRVKANLPGLPSAPPGQGAPGWRDQLAITWLWGSPSGLLLLLPSNPPPSSQTTAGPPSLRHSRTHPVSSTLSPHTVLVQAAPLYYTRKSAPAPQGGCRGEPGATRLRPDAPHRGWGLPPRPEPLTPSLAPYQAPTGQAPCFSPRDGALGPWPPPTSPAPKTPSHSAPLCSHTCYLRCGGACPPGPLTERQRGLGSGSRPRPRLAETGKAGRAAEGRRRPARIR